LIFLRAVFMSPARFVPVLLIPLNDSFLRRALSDASVVN
jgi:hypothetical protein